MSKSWFGVGWKCAHESFPCPWVRSGRGSGERCPSQPWVLHFTEWGVNMVDFKLQNPMSTAWAARGKLIEFYWQNSIYWIIYQARAVLHFVPVLWRQQEPLQDQGVWLGKHCPSVLSTPSLPCSLSRDGKEKGRKARRGYSCSIREIGSERNSYPREAGLRPNPGNVNHSAASAYL